jgi:hypothetical protein
MGSYIWFQRALPLMKNPLPNQTMSGSKFCASRQEFRKIKWFRRWGLVGCRTSCCGTVLTLHLNNEIFFLSRGLFPDLDKCRPSRNLDEYNIFLLR